MQLRSRYTERVPSVKTPRRGTSRTRQEYKKECDINNILARYVKTGQLPDLIKKDPRYGDFSSAPDYQESMAIVVKAQEQFDALSSKIRNRFQNDPAQFLEFATNPENAKEMVQLGLATERRVEGPSNPSSQPLKKASQVKKTENDKSSSKKAPDVGGDDE